MQSERLNNLHLVLFSAAASVKEKSTEFIVKENGNTNCEVKAFRTIAASLNSDEFLDASYLITGDSVELKMRIVYTRYIDKVKTLPTVKGSLSKLNECILGSFREVFTELKVTPSAAEWESISSIVQDDAKKYSVNSYITAEGKINYFLEGKLAYETENYSLARDLLSKVSADDSNYREAQFILGKSHLNFDDYNKAYLCFRKSKDLGFTEKTLDDYVQASALLIKPAVWFHTSSRRKAWWNGLSKEENKQIIELMNALKINGKSYDQQYIYDDNDIAKLFKTTTLPFRHTRLPNFLVYRYFTDVDLIIMENTKLHSDEGIQNFYKLKIIRSDSKIQLPQIAYLTGLKRITLIYSKDQK